VAQLQAWMTTYRPEELFDQAGRLVPELAALAPQGNRRMPEIRGWTWAGGA
jgi:xylulose-5-phosphate/fructose-6-phosphate phosphoketolase